jgi:hypothetical protein
MLDVATPLAPRSQAASLSPQKQAESPTGTHRPPAAKRLAWLDALRGFAALCVVFDHLTYSVLESARNAVYQWFDPGA